MSRQVAVIASMTLLVIGAIGLSTAERSSPTGNNRHCVETRFGSDLFEKPGEFMPIRLIPDDVFELVHSVEYVEGAPGDIERREKWVRRKMAEPVQVSNRVQLNEIVLPRRLRDFSLDTVIPMIQKSSPYYLMTGPAYLPGR